MTKSWLNGWPLVGDKQDTVLVGTAVHCSGCGRFLGTAAVALTEGWDPPIELPDWPFDEDKCPVHRHLPEPEPIGPEAAPEEEQCRVCGGTGRRPQRRLP